jgi:lactate dehydrogenase-like 2-hydroxyacid dehydrogenase
MESVLKHRGLGSPVGATINGKRVLVVGFGALGKEIVKLLNVFSPEAVFAFRHGEWAEHELALVDEAGSFSAATPHSAATGRKRLVEMARKSDVCIMSCPLNPDTAGLLDAEV